MLITQDLPKEVDCCLDLSQKIPYYPMANIGVWVPMLLQFLKPTKI